MPYRYFGLLNRRTVQNKRTGQEFFQKLVNAQYEISAQDVNKVNMINKVKKTAQVDFS